MLLGKVVNEMIRNIFQYLSKNFKKNVALLLCSAFLFSAAVPPFAQASLWQERKENFKSREEKNKNVQGIFQFYGAASHASHSLLGLSLGVQIPEKLGTLVETWSRPELQTSNDPQPFIIQLEDAHGYYEAQKNASELLKLISNQNKNNLQNISKNSKEKKSAFLIGVEGASDRVNPDWLSLFPSDSIKEQTAERLLKEGEIAGEEYLAILSEPGSLLILGIEDREIYQANLKTRKLIDADRAKIASRIEGLEDRFAQIKKQIYSRSLLELDRVSLQFENQKIALKDYAGYLKTAAPASISSYPALDSYQKLTDLEHQISSDAVEIETKKLVAALQEKLDASVLKSLAQMSLDFRLGKIKAQRYYQGLIELAKNVSFAAPHLQHYALYLDQSQNVDIHMLEIELKHLEQSLWNELTKNDSEARHLSLASQQLRLQKKFWSEKLAPADWIYYLNCQKQYASSSKTGAWQNELWSLDQTASAFEKQLYLSPSKKIDFKTILPYAQLKFLQESYYKLAIQRDSAMANHALEQAKKNQQNLMVVIAGGYHTQGMLEVYRQKGISYAVVRPQLQLAATQKFQKEKQKFAQSVVPGTQEFNRALENTYGTLRHASQLEAGLNLGLKLSMPITMALGLVVESGREEYQSQMEHWIEDLKSLAETDKTDKNVADDLKRIQSIYNDLEFTDVISFDGKKYIFAKLKETYFAVEFDAQGYQVQVLFGENAKNAFAGKAVRLEEKESKLLQKIWNAKFIDSTEVNGTLQFGIVPTQTDQSVNIPSTAIVQKNSGKAQLSRWAKAWKTFTAFLAQGAARFIGKFISTTSVFVRPIESSVKGHTVQTYGDWHVGNTAEIIYNVVLANAGRVADVVLNMSKSPKYFIQNPSPVPNPSPSISPDSLAAGASLSGVKAAVQVSSAGLLLLAEKLKNFIASMSSRKSIMEALEQLSTETRYEILFQLAQEKGIDFPEGVVARLADAKTEFIIKEEDLIIGQASNVLPDAAEEKNIDPKTKVLKVTKKDQDKFLSIRVQISDEPLFAQDPNHHSLGQMKYDSQNNIYTYIVQLRALQIDPEALAIVLNHDLNLIFEHDELLNKPRNVRSSSTLTPSPAITETSSVPSLDALDSRNPSPDSELKLLESQADSLWEQAEKAVSISLHDSASVQTALRQFYQQDRTHISVIFGQDKLNDPFTTATSEIISLRQKFEELDQQFKEGLRLLANAARNADNSINEDQAEVRKKIQAAKIAMLKVVYEYYDIGIQALAEKKAGAAADEKKLAYEQNYIAALHAFNRVKMWRPLTIAAYSEAVRGLAYAPGASTLPPLEDSLDDLGRNDVEIKAFHSKGLHLKDVDNKWKSAFDKYVSLNPGMLSVVAIENLKYDLRISDKQLFYGDDHRGRSFKELWEMAVGLHKMLATTGANAPPDYMKKRAAEYLAALFHQHFYNGTVQDSIDQNGGLSVSPTVYDAVLNGITLKEDLVAAEEALVTFGMDFDPKEFESLQGHSLTAMSWLAKLYGSMAKKYYARYVEDALILERRKRQPQLAAALEELESLADLQDMKDLYESGALKEFKLKEQFKNIGGVEIEIPIREELNGGSVGDFAGTSTSQAYLYNLLNAAGVLSQASGSAIGRNIKLGVAITDYVKDSKQPSLSVKSMDMGFIVNVFEGGQIVAKSNADLILKTLSSMGIFPRKMLDQVKNDPEKSQELLRFLVEHFLGKGKAIEIDMHVEKIAAGSGLAVSNLIAVGIALAFAHLLNPLDKVPENEFQNLEKKPQIIVEVSCPENNLSVNDHKGYYQLQVSQDPSFKNNVNVYPAKGVNGKVMFEVPKEVGSSKIYFMRMKYVTYQEVLSGNENKNEFIFYMKLNEITGEKEYVNGSNVQVGMKWRLWAYLDKQSLIVPAILTSQWTQWRMGNYAGTQDDVAALGGFNFLQAGAPLSGKIGNRFVSFPGGVVPEIIGLPISEANRKKISQGRRIIRIGLTDPAEATLQQIDSAHSLNSEVDAENAWIQLSYEMLAAMQLGDVESMGRISLAAIALRQKLAPVSIHPVVVTALEKMMKKYAHLGLSYAITGARSTGSIILWLPQKDLLEKDYLQLYDTITAQVVAELKKSIKNVGKQIPIEDDPQAYQGEIAQRGARIRILSKNEMLQRKQGYIAAMDLEQSALHGKSKLDHALYQPADMAKIKENYPLDEAGQKLRQIFTDNGVLTFDPGVVSLMDKEIVELLKNHPEAILDSESAKGKELRGLIWNGLKDKRGLNENNTPLNRVLKKIYLPTSKRFDIVDSVPNTDST